MAKGRKTGGRRKGSINKSTPELPALVAARLERDTVVDRCRALIESDEYQTYFRHRLMVGQLAPALEALSWYYAYGKPRERVEVTGADGGPIEVHDHLISL